MGLFSMDKSSTQSSSFDERLAASEQGIANRGAQNVDGVGLETSAEHATGSNVIGAGARQAQGSNVASEGALLAQGNAKVDVQNQNVDTDVIKSFGDAILGQQASFGGTLQNLLAGNQASEASQGDTLS